MSLTPKEVLAAYDAGELTQGGLVCEILSLLDTVDPADIERLLAERPADLGAFREGAVSAAIGESFYTSAGEMPISPKARAACARLAGIPHYAISVRWSDEEVGWVATVPDLPGVSAVGGTPQVAACEVQRALRLCVEHARAEGRELPAPARTPCQPPGVQGQPSTSR